MGSLRSALRTPDLSGAFHECEYGVIQKDGGPDSGYLWSSRLPCGSGFLGVQAFLEADSRFFTFQGGAFTESPREPLSSSISWGAFLHGRGTSGFVNHLPTRSSGWIKKPKPTEVRRYSPPAEFRSERGWTEAPTEINLKLTVQALSIIY